MRRIQGPKMVSLIFIGRHDNYDAEPSPDPKWVAVSDVGEATFGNEEAKAS
jgi:hypothetical protein